MKETVPEIDVMVYNYLLAKAGTPNAIVERMTREVEAVMNSPEVKQSLTARGLESFWRSPIMQVGIMQKSMDDARELLQATGMILEQ